MIGGRVPPIGYQLVERLGIVLGFDGDGRQRGVAHEGGGRLRRVQCGTLGLTRRAGQAILEG